MRHRVGKGSVGVQLAVLAATLLVALVSGAMAANAASARSVLVYVGKGSPKQNFTGFAGAAGLTTYFDGTPIDEGIAPASFLARSACVILDVNQYAFTDFEIQSMKDYMAGGGTLIALGEWGSSTPGGGYASGVPLANMNNVASRLGMSMSLDPLSSLDPGVHVTSNLSVDPIAGLTSGVTSYAYAATSALIAAPPARVLASTELSATPFVGVQSYGKGRFVLAGDSDGTVDGAAWNATAATPGSNGAFARNLCGDRTAPLVQIAVPVDGAHYKRGQVVKASYQCTDTEGFGDIASCIGNVPVGQPIDTTGTPGGTVTKSFSVTGTDTAGNSASAQVTYYVDDSPPVITLTRPTDGATYTLGQSVAASYSCQDDDEVASLTGSVPSGTPINTFTTGAHTFTVTCTDRAGNTATTTVTYNVVDDQGPVITLQRPADGGAYRIGASVSALYSCTDNDALAPGSPAAPVPTNSPFDTSGISGQTVTKTFTVTCADRSGNVATPVTATYKVDGSPPQITVNQPIDGGRYRLNQNDPTTKADYSCQDDDQVASLTGTVPLGQQFNTSSAGNKAFTVTCTDRAGNTATKVVNYLVDDQPPVITISAPADGGRYRFGQQVPAAYGCTDNDGVAAGSPTGTVALNQPFDTSAAGSLTFTVTCFDKAGNKAVKTVTYTVDASPPGIAIGTPQDGVRYRIGAVVATDFTCFDPDDAFVVGGDIASCAAAGQASGSPLDTTGTSGQTVTKTFTVNARDLSGNAASQSVSYIVDGAPPVITITVPADAGRYVVGSSHLAAYGCTDDDAVADGFPVGDVAVGGSIDTVQPGTKQFTVTCQDKVGNVATKTVSYKVVGNNPPAVEITSPKDGASYAQNATIPFTFACSDPDGADDLASCQRTSDPVSSAKPGTFKVSAEAVDLEGHRASKTVTYTVTGKPAAAAAPTAAAGTPAARVCKSRRQFTIRVKKTKKKQKVRIVRAVIYVNGKKTQVKKGRRVTAVVTLKGLPKGRYKVVIEAKLSDGRTITDVRRFKTCTPKGK